MGYIKEPEGVDLMVDPSTFTMKDRQMISNIIANCKKHAPLRKQIRLLFCKVLKNCEGKIGH